MPSSRPSAEVLGRTRLEIVVGDITRLAVDAIVNAADPSLLGGGGVDGAIHRAAGPGLLAECRALGVCVAGDAKITGGHDLPARHVIHAVGPVWRGGSRGEASKLSACYSRAIALAREARLVTLAFPNISTGAYRYPPEAAADVSLGAVLAALDDPCSLRRVLFCCFTTAAAEIRTAAMRRANLVPPLPVAVADWR